MGESACLVRSFSNPAEISHEAKEGDPIRRALTESVSFGRFISESLAWEKWSTFSHNRYLEEVEKFSKPGSVAQKKAFFEAHYKKRAEMRAAALLEQANTVVVTNDASQMKSTSADQVDPSLNSDSAIASPPLSINQQKKNDPGAEVANAADNTIKERENMEITDAENGQAEVEKDVNMENNNLVDNSKALEFIDNQSVIKATPDKMIPHEESTDRRNSTSSSKKRRTNSFSKPSTPNSASRLPLHPSKRVASAQDRNVASVAAEAPRNSTHTIKSIPRTVHMSFNFASGNKTNKRAPRIPKDNSAPLQTPTRAFKKTSDQENLAPPSETRQSNSASKFSKNGGASKLATSRVGNNYPLTDRKSIVESDKHKRMVQKSLHMSMNLSPCAGQTNKTLPELSRKSSTPMQTPIKASVNVGSDLAPKVTQSQDKRTRAVLNKSVSGGVTGDGRWPPFSNCSKSSRASGTITKSPTSPFPFSFRSEERAAKRKEFFNKLEDRTNSREAEKSKMQIQPKEKAKNYLGKLRQSTDVKARPNEELYPSHHHNKKITSTWPQSPKFERKQSSSTVQDANSRPPRRPCTNSESSKNAFMKNNRVTCSVTSKEQA